MPALFSAFDRVFVARALDMLAGGLSRFEDPATPSGGRAQFSVGKPNSDLVRHSRPSVSTPKPMDHRVLAVADLLVSYNR